MRRLIFGILAGFGVTVGSFMVIADTSFFTPTVGVQEGEAQPQDQVVRVAAEPGLQADKEKGPSVDSSEGKRIPQNTVGAPTAVPGSVGLGESETSTGKAEDGLKVVLRNSNENSHKVAKGGAASADLFGATAPAVKATPETLFVEKTPVEKKKSSEAAPADLAAKTSAKPSKSSQAEKMFSIQVGSYKTRKDAEERVSKVSKDGFGAFVQPAEVNGAQFFRVRLGPFESKEEAKSQLSRVRGTAWGSDAILATESN